MTHARNTLWRNRAVIVIIALISVIPFGLAWYYVRHPELIGKTSNYGELIVPPWPLDPAEMLARPRSKQTDLRGRWVLVQVAPTGCGDSCRETLYKTRQIRLMLNKEIARVRRLLLVSPGFPPAELNALAQGDETLIITEASSALLRTLSEALGGPPREDMVVLMDPLANLILRYAPGFDPYRVVKDLKHLLKASQIG